MSHYSSGNVTIAKKASKRNQLVELLVNEMSADLDIDLINSQKRSRTALIMAARLGHFEMVEILLRRQGINVDLQDEME